MLSRSSTVQATLVLELLDSDGDTSPVHAELRYDSGDPFAVRGDFCLDEQVVRWVFARSLLRTGLYEPTGCWRRTGAAVAGRRRPRRGAHRAVLARRRRRAAGPGQRRGHLPAPHRGTGSPRVRERPRRPRPAPSPSCSTSPPPDPAG